MSFPCGRPLASARAQRTGPRRQPSDFSQHVPVFAMTPSPSVPDFTEESPAYEAGWTAYQRDLDRTENPYETDEKPEAFHDWRRGWNDALEEDEAVEQ